MNEYLLVPLETVPHPLSQGWMLLKAKEVYLGSVVVEQSPELLTPSLCTPLPTMLTSNGHLVSHTQAQASPSWAANKSLCWGRGVTLSTSVPPLPCALVGPEPGTQDPAPLGTALFPVPG